MTTDEVKDLVQSAVRKQLSKITGRLPV